jgi:hypothetical protein
MADGAVPPWLETIPHLAVASPKAQVGARLVKAPSQALAMTRTSFVIVSRYAFFPSAESFSLSADS